MRGLRQILFVLGLGAFWSAGPALSKMLGLAGVPVADVVVLAGFGVGLTLAAFQRAGGGRVLPDQRELLFGLGCGLLTNTPFVIGLFAIRHVPVALMAVVTSTSPLWTYALALALRRETYSTLRLAALALGLSSSLAVILTRPGASFASIDGWVLATLSLPVLWGVYNNFASAAWPVGMPVLTAGMTESLTGGFLGLPLLLLLDRPAAASPGWHGFGYQLLFAMIVMWVLERICFFSLIQRFGPVTAVQATYVATPGAVILGVLFFTERPDAWLGLSLALLMAALWLNQRATRHPSARSPAPEAA